MATLLRPERGECVTIDVRPLPVDADNRADITDELAEEARAAVARVVRATGGVLPARVVLPPQEPVPAPTAPFEVGAALLRLAAVTGFGAAIGLAWFVVAALVP